MCELLLVKYMRHEYSIFRNHYLDKTGSQQTLDSDYQSWEAFLVLYTEQNETQRRSFHQGFQNAPHLTFSITGLLTLASHDSQHLLDVHHIFLCVPLGFKDEQDLVLVLKDLTVRVGRQEKEIQW